MAAKKSKPAPKKANPFPMKKKKKGGKAC